MGNSFTEGRNYLWGFGIASIFVTLFIIDAVNNQITNSAIDKITEGCYVTFKDRPVNLERCVKQSQHSKSFDEFNVGICGDCSEKGLCLQGDDLTYCQTSISKDEGILKLRSFLKSITSPFTQYSTQTNIYIIMALFVIGFIGSAIL